jgi:hypothetical protein
MRFRVADRLYSFSLAALLALVVWGVVGLAGIKSISWDSLDDDDAPVGVVVQELGLPSLPSPRALPEGRVERVSAESPSRSHCPTLHFSTSCGVPAETGKDLLTYLQIRRT